MSAPPTGKAAGKGRPGKSTSKNAGKDNGQQTLFAMLNKPPKVPKPSAAQIPLQAGIHSQLAGNFSGGDVVKNEPITTTASPASSSGLSAKATVSASDVTDTTASALLLSTSPSTSISVPSLPPASRSAPITKPGITIEEITGQEGVDEDEEDESKKEFGQRKDDPDSMQTEVEFDAFEQRFPGWRTNQPDPVTDDCSFQMMDIDWHMDTIAGANRLEPLIPQPYPMLTHETPVVRLYGRTMQGQSVLLHAHNFLSYFWVMVPEEEQTHAHDSRFMKEFQIELEEEVAACQWEKMMYKKKVARKAEKAERKRRKVAARADRLKPIAIRFEDVVNENDMDIDASPGRQSPSMISQPGALSRANSTSCISQPGDGGLSRHVSGDQDFDAHTDAAAVAMDDDDDADKNEEGKEGAVQQKEDEEEDLGRKLREMDVFGSAEDQEEALEEQLEGIRESAGKKNHPSGDSSSSCSSSSSDEDVEVGPDGKSMKWKAKKKGDWIPNKEKARQYHAENQPCVESVTVDSKRSIMYYTTQQSRVWKITMTNPLFITAARRILTKKGLTFWAPSRDHDRRMFFKCFECNIAFELRFMTNTNMMGPAWLTLKKGAYSSRKGKNPVREPGGRCNLEFDVAWDKIQVESHLQPKWSVVAPIRILSFDIESLASSGFPDANKGDPAITIASACYVHGYCSLEPGKESIHDVVFQLGTCKVIPGKQVIACKTIYDLYDKFFRYVNDVDADILTGWNIGNFDIPELHNGAKYYNVPSFAELGRILNEPARLESSRFESKAHGKRASYRLVAHGLIMLDMLPEIRKEHKLRSYTLNAVAAHFTKQQKLDLHYSLIPEYQNKDSYHRRLLSAYCWQDALLPLLLIIKLKFFINLLEMARATGVPIGYLLFRGQQVKVVSLILRFIFATDFLFPYHEVEKGITDKYLGALVLLALAGYYDEPIATLDFASLYPSIMIRHNTSYECLVHPAHHNQLHMLGLKPEDVTFNHVTGKPLCFVNRTHTRGILPQILETLLAARQAARTAMKVAEAAGHNEEAQILNGRQLALKISANSVYGFTSVHETKL